MLLKKERRRLQKCPEAFNYLFTRVLVFFNVCVRLGGGTFLKSKIGQILYQGSYFHFPVHKTEVPASILLIPRHSVQG